MKTGSFICAVLITVLSGFSARAWNSTGHMTVAELAWRALSSDEKAAVSKLLRQHPHYDELLTKNIPDGPDHDEQVFLRAATWPDMVRPSRPPQPKKPEHITAYHRENWHFINLPYVAPGDLGAIKPAEHPPQATNAVERLARMEAEMKDLSLQASNRAVALCWYLHLMGDVHQPLHCVAWYSPEFNGPHGDSGGNEVAIKPRTSPLRLHAFWDDQLGTGESFVFIHHVADGIGNDPKLASAKLKEFKSHKTYSSWAAESFDAARHVGYLDGQIQHAKWQDGIKADAVPDLDTGYEAAVLSMAQRRVALAGFRLAQKLKILF